jgi:hypothetical protein
MSCNAITGEIGPVVIPSTGFVHGLALCNVYLLPVCTRYSHIASTTVPARKPWTPSTHALWPLSAQHSAHVAVAVLRKAHSQGRQMQVPYELVEIILMHVV